MKKIFVLCFLFFLPFMLHAQSGKDSIGLQLIAEGLTHPLTLVESPDSSGRLFIVDQAGRIMIIKSGEMLATPFLDLRSTIVPLSPFYDERGLLGLAFHPDYSQNGKFYVMYNVPPVPGSPDSTNSTIYVSQFKVSADADVADPDSEKVLLKVNKPQMNHNGGTIAFGPADGYLYISIGDGGGANDSQRGHVQDWYGVNRGGNGQDIDSNLLGNILRIDVDNGERYAIPSDNPFVGKDGLDEIFAYGFRNPYRFSFDMGGDHTLYAGDAGQNLYEEVDVVVKGGNYGWNVKEGTHCFNEADADTSLADCPSVAANGDTLIDPVIEFLNSEKPGGVGAVVIGGYVYRGNAFPSLRGRYIFGTWTYEEDAPAGLIFSAQPKSGSGLWNFDTLLISKTDENELHHYVLGFGQDQQGEVYIMTTDSGGPSGTTGKVFKIISPTSTAVADNGQVPGTLQLYQNYPNPFNPSTRIKYSLPAETHVSVKVYDMLGRFVSELVNEKEPAGSYEAVFNGSNVSSGLYIYKLQTENKTLTGKMMLMK